MVGGRQVDGAAAHRQRAPASPVVAGRAVTVMSARRPGHHPAAEVTGPTSDDPARQRSSPAASRVSCQAPPGAIYRLRRAQRWLGRKRWIGNAVWCDVIVVYARDTQDGQVKAFVVEKDNPGYAASKITGKVALRMVQNADITLTDCRVSDEARLQDCNSFADVARVLKGTRNTVSWASAGHGVAAYDIALNYAQRRKQFGRPIAKNQLIQSMLVEMLGEVTAMQLYCIRLGRLIDDGQMSDTMASLAKYFCTVKARHVCRMARDILGGNGILLDFHVMRHMCDMEALLTYEGTAEIQTLLVGRDITGQGAFA